MENWQQWCSSQFVLTIAYYCVPMSTRSGADVPVWWTTMTCRLRSQMMIVFRIVSVTRLSTVGDRAFPVTSARLWNSLPLHVTSAPSLSTVHTHLSPTSSLFPIPVSYSLFSFSMPAQWLVILTFTFFKHSVQYFASCWFFCNGLQYYTLNIVSKCCFPFSLYLNICGLRTGPGKPIVGSCKVLEKS